MLAGYGKTMGTLLAGMVIGLLGVVLIPQGFATNNAPLALTGILMGIVGFVALGYVVIYIRLVKFSLEEFYNLLVRVDYGISYFVTFSINQIETVVNEEFLKTINKTIPTFVNELFKNFQIFIVHYEYATKGDMILIAPDSPRAISSPKQVEVLIRNWIARTKVAEMTGLELTHIKQTKKRELTFMEKFRLRFSGKEPAGNKTIEFENIPIVLVYDSDITPALMKAKLYGIPQIAKDAKEAQSLLEQISKQAVITMSKPFEQEINALKDHIGEQDRIISMEKIPYSFETSEPEVNTPTQRKNDNIKQVVKYGIIAVFAIMVIFLAYSQYIATSPANNGVSPIGGFTLTVMTRGIGDTTPISGTYTYETPTTVNLTATPRGGSTFVEWCIATSATALNCQSTLTTAQIQIKISNSLIVIAIFQGGNQMTTSVSTTTTSESITTMVAQ